MALFIDETILEILRKYRRLWALSHASALMGWDSETYMPVKGAGERGFALAEMATLYQELLLKDEFTSAVKRVASKDGLNEYERGVIRVLDREIKIMRKLPPKLVYELSKTSQDAFQKWREARAKSDFNILSPYLDKLVQLNREKAEALGYEEHPYDALLDLHEEGLRTRDVDRLFSYLKGELKVILDSIESAGYYSRLSDLGKAKYKINKMEKVNRAVLDMLGYPWERARLDISPHPFTQEMGINDVRITTRYEGVDFKRSLFSTIHEFGHATYELQIDHELGMTPVGTGVSLGVHEGQSRFWENIIGRSRAFTELLKPILDSELGTTLDYSIDELYRYFVEVRPSTIRTEADEVTYNLHIALRYQLEKMLISNEISVNDVPELWNNLMDEMLGVRPRDDAEGVLQDVHWSHGSMGYFPTYTLGNVVAAQVRAAYIGNIGDLEKAISEKNFQAIKAFLAERIHKWGSVYAPKDLLWKALGEEYQPSYLVSYLKEKYVQA